MAGHPLEQKDETVHPVAVGYQMGEGVVVQAPQLRQLRSPRAELFDQGRLCILNGDGEHAKMHIIG